MNRKDVIHNLLKVISFEVFEFIRENEKVMTDRWVPAAEIKKKLELNLDAVPRQNPNQGQKGWLFAIVARMLEDEGLLEYRNEGSRSFYRTRKAKP